MKKGLVRGWLFAVLILLLFAGNLVAQESNDIVQTYRRNFSRANTIPTRLRVLQDAATVANVNMGPVFLDAVDYILTDTNTLASNGNLRSLADFSIEQIFRLSYAPAIPSLWRLFGYYNSTASRVRILQTIAQVATTTDPSIAESDLVAQIGSWLENQNSIRRAGTRIDEQTLQSCIESLGRIGSPRSFTVLFSTLTAGYPDVTNTIIRTALSRLRGDLQDMYREVIRISPALQKLRALEDALASDRLSALEKAELAAYALDTGFARGSPNMGELAVLRDLRYLAIRVIAEQRYTPAVDNVVRQFNEVLIDFERGISTKLNLLEVIGCLGVMASPQAAASLNHYLALLNTYSESGRTFDEQIVIAVIDGLGNLGDPIARENLLYTRYLGYSGSVMQAAQNAVARLR